MNNTIEYKGYVGSVEFSEADGLFFGKVQGIRALLSYEGSNASELVNDFHTVVDDYLNLCTAEGKKLNAPIRAASISAFHLNSTSRPPSMPYRTTSP